jgi:hypothetical protein
MHVYVQCVCMWGRGVLGSGPQTDKHLPQSPLLQVNLIRLLHFALPSLSLHKFEYETKCNIMLTKKKYIPSRITVFKNHVYSFTDLLYCMYSM